MPKLISLNVEKDTHLDRQARFFARERPDILCLHELFREDFERLRDEMGGHGTFAPMCSTACDGGGEDILGSAIVSRMPLENVEAHVYRNADRPLATYVWGKTPQSALKRTLQIADVVPPVGQPVRLATTHFTWSADAAVTAEQKQDIRKVLELLSAAERCVFCGDMNAPRGGEIFAAIAARYRDCIPPGITTSIDGDLHYAGDLQLLVDGLFVSPHYQARDVRLEGGVSDHYAIVATIARR